MCRLKPTRNLTISLAVAIIIGLGCFISPAGHAQTKAPEPFFGLVVNPEHSKPVKIVATVMEISPYGDPSIVVAEKTILITEYELAGQVHRTQLIASDGEALKLQDLKIGQRVIVNGLQLPDKTIIGERIQVKPRQK